MREIRNFAEGEFYHLYNRGNNKQEIFLDEKDYDRFAKLLYLCNSNQKINFREDIIEKDIDAYEFEREELIISIGAWVLMPNHFHLYVAVPQRPDLWTVSDFAQKLCVGYSMYFNKRHSRTGALFGGRFKSTHIENDQQAKYLFSYIHLNPVKIIDSSWKIKGPKNKDKILNFLYKYKWSSYSDYKNKKRKESVIITPQNFPDYFSDPKVFEKEIFSWLSFNDANFPKTGSLGK
jgi:putative transposase